MDAARYIFPRRFRVPSLPTCLHRPLGQKEIEPFDFLTAREQQVPKLVGEGCTNYEITQTLNLSVTAIEKHCGRLMRKLDVHDTVTLFRIAVRHRLIFMDA